MRMVVYQAMLANPTNIARARAARRDIQAIGGDLVEDPPNKVGMTLLTLYLPERYQPDHFLPGIPFYPI
ncbi:MAG: hypothetical protein OJF49_001744 [Ktedonobacterales bacterium]|jgi:hypothetical protein|nr:MAG: hypothetical protein OJF49_001744 [Ktedonobacterales bacterium]